MEENTVFNILQICDSAFPTGGFSHSMGTESAVQNLFVNNQDTLKIFVIGCLENAGSSCIPFIKAAYEAASDLPKLIYLDSLHNALLLNHVAHRASKQQGKAFIITSHQVFPNIEIEQIITLADDQKMHCHFPIVFAVVCAALKIPVLKVVEMFLFNCLRTIVASIVRLGKIGAIQAQCFQYEIQHTLNNILSRNWNLSPEESCITYPLPEILQNCHDNMFSKLFFS